MVAATVSTTLDQTSSVRELFHSEASADYEWAGPTQRCACGSDVFLFIGWFDEEREIAGYFTEGRCAVCNADLRLPTAADEYVR